MCLKHELLIYYNFPIAQLSRVVYVQIAHDTGGKELNMSEISIAENTQLQTIRDLSIATFRQTFAGTNTEEDMRDYIAHGLSPEVLGKELADPLQTFFVATVDGVPAGYMKVNLARRKRSVCRTTMPKSRDSTCLRISNVTVWEPGSCVRQSSSRRHMASKRCGSAYGSITNRPRRSIVEWDSSKPVHILRAWIGCADRPDYETCIDRLLITPFALFPRCPLVWHGHR